MRARVLGVLLVALLAASFVSASHGDAPWNKYYGEHDWDRHHDKDWDRHHDWDRKDRNRKDRFDKRTRYVFIDDRYDRDRYDRRHYDRRPRVQHYGYDSPREVHVYRHHVKNVFVEASPHYYPSGYSYKKYDRACRYSGSSWNCRY